MVHSSLLKWLKVSFLLLLNSGCFDFFTRPEKGRQGEIMPAKIAGCPHNSASAAAGKLRFLPKKMTGKGIKKNKYI
jgi:hypothetical protein